LPFQGLDSFQADKVVDKLAELAHADGAVVLASLHAPRSASFARCDDLLLMAPAGRVAYCGPAAGALAWFAGGSPYASLPEVMFVRKLSVLVFWKARA
jgi:ABC-type multidrug transport system ATPase subunit